MPNESGGHRASRDAARPAAGPLAGLRGQPGRQALVLPG